MRLARTLALTSLACGLGPARTTHAQSPVGARVPPTPKAAPLTAASTPGGAFAMGADDCSAPHTNAGSGDVSGLPFVNATTGTTGQNESNCLFFGLTGIDDDVWFDWTATMTGVATLDLCNNGGDTKIAVWPLSTCPAGGSSIVCNDDSCALDSVVSWSCTAGTSYTFQLGTFPGTPGGSGTFAVYQSPPPPCGHKDDGTTENAFGLIAGGEVGWLTVWDTGPGTCLATWDNVETAYGTLQFPGSVTNGAASRVVVFQDADADDDPRTGLALRAAVSTVVTNGDTDITNLIPLGVVIQDAQPSKVWTLVTADQAAGEYPTPMDQTPPTHAAGAWVVGSTLGPGTLDVFDLNDNDVPPLNMAASGYSTNFLLRIKNVGNGGATNACPDRGTILFERSTDTISIPANTVLGPNFTAEAVVMFCSDLPVTNGVVFQEQYDQLEDKALIAWGGGVGGTAQTPSTPGSFVVTPLAIPNGIWHHVAFVADGTQQRVYLDGALIGSRPVSGDVDDTPLSKMSIGAFVEPIGGEFRGAFTGLMDSLRISNVARYSGNSFAPPSGDLPADASTLLLYHFLEGPDSTTVADSSGNGRTGTLGVGFAGATAPKLAVPMCCPQRGAIEFDQSTDTISIPGNTSIGTSFTAEARVMFCDDLPVTNGVVFQEQYDMLEDKALIAWGGGIGGTAQTPATPGSFVLTPLALTPGVWHHVAFVEGSGLQRVYLDGFLLGSRPVTGDVDDAPLSRMSLGAFVEPIGGEFRGAFTGYMDTLRVSNVARYTGNSFTPPAGDLPADASTLLLYNFDEAPGSATVADSSGNGFTGTLGTGFAGATEPRLAAKPCTATGSIGTPLCFGDGSGAPCPCGNQGAAGRGCANSTGGGARLTASGNPSVSADTMTLTADGVVNNNGYFLQGNNVAGGGSGIVFGDGLRCCAGGIVRIQVVNPPGTASPATAQMTETATTNGPMGTIQPGSAKCYQFWYRDPNGSPCGFQFNLTNAVSIVWQP